MSYKSIRRQLDFWKWEKYLKRYNTKEVAKNRKKKYMKRPLSLLILEMRIKIKMTCHYNPTWIAKIKRLTIPSVDKD